MLNIKKTAAATTLLGMALSAVLLVGCGGNTSANSGKPAPTQTPPAHAQTTPSNQDTAGKQPTSASNGQGTVPNSGASGGQGSAPSAGTHTAPAQPTCTVKVAGHCVVIDPQGNSAGSAGQNGSAPSAAQIPGNGARPSGTQTRPQASATAAPPAPNGTQYTPPSRPHASATAPAHNGGNGKTFSSN